jgi:dihydrofolate reductase
MSRPRTSAFVGVTLDGFLARPDGTLGWPYQGKRCVVLTHRPLVCSHGEQAYAAEPATVLSRLQEAGAKHVYVDGGVVVRDFLSAGLLDSLTLSVVPVLIGAGRPLFGGVRLESGLHLEGVTSFSNGIAQLRYSCAAR